MSRYDQHIEINVLDRATQALDRIIERAKELREQDTVVDIDAGSGFFETQEQIRATREQIDALALSYEKLSTKSGKHQSSKSLSKDLKEIKTLAKETRDLYTDINSESVNEGAASALYDQVRGLQKTVQKRLESVKAVEKENAALRKQAQEIQRCTSAAQEYFNTIQRIQQMTANVGAGGAYSYAGRVNALDGSYSSGGVAGYLGSATNFTMQGVPYDPTIGQAIMAYPANPYAGTGYVLKGSAYGASYKPTGTVVKNDNVIVIDMKSVF